MAIRNFASRIVIMSAVIAVLFLTGSRTSTIATIFGLLIVIWYRLKARSMMFKIALLVSFIFAIITVLLTVDPAINSIKEYFAISDRYRGFGTGASGRVEAWGSAWRLFLNHPLTGVGFRAHERYLSGAEGASSHNGYLAALAEIGLIGFCSNILFIFFGFFRLKSIVNIPNLTFSHSVLFGLACGYLLIGLFERYLINVGNPTSLLFLLCLTLPVESKGTQSKFVNQVLIEKKFA
jgi:O-antigen ligase